MIYNGISRNRTRTRSSKKEFLDVESWQQRDEDEKIMRNILIGIIIFLIVYLFLSLRKSKRETGPGKINRCTEMLGLKPGASQEELVQAYRDLANVWHPDRFADNPRLQKKAEEKIKEINAAYEYIKSFYGKT